MRRCAHGHTNYADERMTCTRVPPLEGRGRQAAAPERHIQHPVSSSMRAGLSLELQGGSEVLQAQVNHQLTHRSVR